MSGTIVFTDAGDPAHPSTHAFTATSPPQRRVGAPQRHEFTPTAFYRQFSAANKPVLTVSPGDTVHTTTVDAGGTDEKGVTRVLGGNPVLVESAQDAVGKWKFEPAQNETTEIVQVAFEAQ